MRRNLLYFGRALVAWTAAAGVGTVLCGCSEVPTDLADPAGLSGRVGILLFVASTSEGKVGLAWFPGGTEALIERRAHDGAFREIGISSLGHYSDVSVAAGCRYEYRVRGVLGDESVVSGSVSALAQSGDAPGMPFRPHPTMWALDVSLTDSLRWSADAVSFDIYVGSGDGWRRIAYDIRRPSTAIPACSVGGRGMRWRVVAKGPTGASTISPEWAFFRAPDRFVVFEGPFVMGDAGSPHPGLPVRIGRFSVDRYEVSNELFASYLNAVDASADGSAVLSGRGQVLLDMRASRITHLAGMFLVAAGWDLHPVTGTTWHGAHSYASHVGRRLPSEAEWEKTARGVRPELGDTTIIDVSPSGDSVAINLGLGFPYPWGEAIDGQVANFAESGDPFDPGTTPVGFFNGERRGSFQTRDDASPYGAADMAGNVSEWTADWFGPYRDPHRPPPSGLLKVVRGGSFRSSEAECRNAVRHSLLPTAAEPWLGFRTVGPP